MAIEFVCPSCGGTLQVGDETAGRVIRCGACMTALRVPMPDPGPRSAPSAPPAPSAPASPFEHDAPVPSSRSKRSSSRDPEPNPDELPTAHRVDPRRDDEPPPPRRRRRRPPEPLPVSSGSGRVFMWLLIIGTVGFLGVVATCAGVFFMMPKPQWHAHESKEGGFKVQAPGPVQPGVERAAALALEQGEKSEGTVLLTRGGQQYIVIYKDIPSTKDRAAKNEKDEQEIDEGLEKLLKTSGVDKPRSDKTMRVNGFPAREIAFNCDAGWYTIRMIVADTRLYTLVVHGIAKPGDGDVRKFIDSFEITDKELVKKGEERKAEDLKLKKKDKGDGKAKNRDKFNDDTQERENRSD